jgi:hypothetical protein
METSQKRDLFAQGHAYTLSPDDAQYKLIELLAHRKDTEKPINQTYASIRELSFATGLSRPLITAILKDIQKRREPEIQLNDQDSHTQHLLRERRELKQLRKQQLAVAISK